MHLAPHATSPAAPPPRAASRAPRLLRLLGAAALAGSLLAVPAARACSICACGDPLILSSDPAAIDGKLRLQLDTEYVRVDAGNEADPALTDKLTQWSYRLNAVYRPLESLSFTGTLPWVSKVIRTQGDGVDDKASDLSGLGDAEVAARWAPLRSIDLGKGQLHEVAISGGTALPTGKKDARDASGALIDPHGQVGTGGWGPFVGLHYRFERGAWSAYAGVSYRWRTEASYFDGSKYKFGDALLYSAHAQWLPAKGLAVDLGLDGRDAKADRSTNDLGEVEPAVVNTGGRVLSIAPGVYWNAVGSVWVFARGQIPVAKSLKGEQDVLPSATVGIQLQVL